MCVCNYKLISGICFVPLLGSIFCVSLYALLLWTDKFMGKNHFPQSSALQIVFSRESLLKQAKVSKNS